jgi:ABC-type amino acid transport substrate-binding protein
MTGKQIARILGIERKSHQRPGNPHLGYRPSTHPKPTPGAHGATASESAAARDHAAARTFDAWFRSLTPEEQQPFKDAQVDKYLSAHSRFQTPGEDALDLADRELIPESAIRGHRNGRPIVALENQAIEILEPETRAIPIDDLPADQVAAAAEDFATALRWAFSSDSSGLSTEHSSTEPSHHLVHLGHRTIALIAVLRSDLAPGLPLDAALARQFLETLSPSKGIVRDTLARLRQTGAIYGRLLEWIRRTTSISGVGERLQLVAYVVRPDLIDAATLAALGEATNKTRQAKDKHANCLRDTFATLRALVMRDNSTRRLCQEAQLA